MVMTSPAMGVERLIARQADISIGSASGHLDAVGLRHHHRDARSHAASAQSLEGGDKLRADVSNEVHLSRAHLLAMNCR